MATAVLGAALGAVAWLEWGRMAFETGDAGESLQAASGLPVWLWAALYGAVIGVAGLIGDLCESLMKRDAEVKDSAALFPGMGGALDLLDSLPRVVGIVKNHGYGGIRAFYRLGQAQFSIQ